MSGKPPRPTARPSVYHRQSSTLHYQTFPTAPPRNAGRQVSKRDIQRHASRSPTAERRPQSSGSGDGKHEETPLPKGQLAILALIALAEQTALNSISPYIPEMAATFPEVGEAQAILVQVFMGLVNGNQAVISTCLGEITDRSNQSRAFTYLPVIYGLGGITGPIVGGLMVMRYDPSHPDRPNTYPYLLPNLFSAAILILDMIGTMFFLKESLECAQELPPLGKRVSGLFTWIRDSTSMHRPASLGGSQKPVNGERHPGQTSPLLEEDEDDSDYDNDTTDRPNLLPSTQQNLKTTSILNRDTLLLLATFFIFQLCNISYNSLYPAFGQSSPPTGRSLTPEEIGLTLAFAGAISIIWQVGLFGRIREKMGNKMTYRVSLAGFVVAFVLMPFVGYKSGTGNGDGAPTMKGKAWLWVELGVVLLIKTVAAVGGLTSALLLITNSAPSHAVLGTLNGLAQTLSAAGRAVGPFVSGSLFSYATKVRPKGEALAFGVFGGVAFLGCLLSFGIRGADLEADGWEEEEGDEERGDRHGDEEETLLGDDESRRR
ncbi:hypothetical protein LTR91_012022 [Friedmanniomyces endolithicus]|uniref:Major facilitator superfamily (MFS) profile domain-containing protein n=1 Tax=Friedmanniomyces endolithicus TaxID=329885 RepID=A0AAN6KGD1_9PEZI|nr:hypothetical protein LTR57_014222 [Friedmanniomyces endolithicus]KAK0981166.1 hypothetical protein LTR91_012022 [Friedmanniomyces endolithicus]KAK0994729.1 hypothetical protein LTS01_006977 [Friedmanniomyces endolithicus]KAK1035121.1 hypothetical protein LTS16_014825 [Friedmanniomyces endolithicus]